MKTTVKGEDGTEIYLGESETRPGATKAVIFASTPERVQQVIQDLANEWSCATFTFPTRCANGKWGAIGHVSGARTK